MWILEGRSDIQHGGCGGGGGEEMAGVSTLVISFIVPASLLRRLGGLLEEPVRVLRDLERRGVKMGVEL